MSTPIFQLWAAEARLFDAAMVESLAGVRDDDVEFAATQLALLACGAAATGVPILPEHLDRVIGPRCVHRRQETSAQRVGKAIHVHTHNPNKNIIHKFGREQYRHVGHVAFIGAQRIPHRDAGDLS